ncbi:MAG TPA: GNAT family N-acetyltransferase [Candidatus Baltobacteraceae bacterium]|nr:GNAT family N-acetyltransferase [Candidatus Baltobacteraceae bacterium]
MNYLKIEINCRRAVSEDDRAAVFAIRRSVFVEEQGVSEELERDEHDADAWHVIAESGERIIGAARCVGAKIGRVAVLHQFRGQRVGRQLMEWLLRELQAQNLTEVYLDAQVQVIPFYEQLGFAVEGELFEEAGILHRRMRRRLSTLP